MLTGVSLSEGGWRVRSNKLELPLGGGSGEPCIQPLGVCAASAAQTPSVRCLWRTAGPGALQSVGNAKRAGARTVYTSASSNNLLTQ